MWHDFVFTAGSILPSMFLCAQEDQDGDVSELEEMLQELKRSEKAAEKRKSRQGSNQQPAKRGRKRKA